MRPDGNAWAQFMVQLLDRFKYQLTISWLLAKYTGKQLEREREREGGGARDVFDVTDTGCGAQDCNIHSRILASFNFSNEIIK